MLITIEQHAFKKPTALNVIAATETFVFVLKAVANKVIYRLGEITSEHLITKHLGENVGLLEGVTTFRFISGHHG